MPDMITVSELSDVSGIPAATIRWHCRRGRLHGKVHDTGRIWLIPSTVADEFVSTYEKWGRDQ